LGQIGPAQCAWSSWHLKRLAEQIALLDVISGGRVECDVGRDLSHPEPECDALAHLFAGAIGSYKNPHSHRTVNLTDLAEAQEQVMLATHLLRIVEGRRPK
jgi:hypothetical protein